MPRKHPHDADAGIDIRAQCQAVSRPLKMNFAQKTMAIVASQLRQQGGKAGCSWHPAKAWGDVEVLF
jgi:hypothetical protein